MSVLLGLALAISRASALDAQAPAQRTPASLGVPSQVVSTFLRDWMRTGGNELFDTTLTESETWAIAARLPLERSQLRATAVYLSGWQWCGTGGCRLVVVTEDSAGTVRFAGDVELAQLPIRVLATHHGGWPDLGVSVFGGGERPHLALLRYDGQQYQGETTADLPEVPAAQSRGRALITDAMPETRLWPAGAPGTLVQRCLVVMPTTFGPVYTHRRCLTTR